jgi:hypothetical protein
MLHKAGLGLVVLSALGCSQGATSHSSVEVAEMTKASSNAKVSPAIITPIDKSDDMKAKLIAKSLFDGKLIVDRVAGSAMKVTLQYTNNQSHGVPLMFRSGMTADLWLFNSTGKKVWAWSNEMMFTQALRETVMAAGKTQNVKFSITADMASAIEKGYYLQAIFSGRATESTTPAMAPVLYKF